MLFFILSLYVAFSIKVVRSNEIIVMFFIGREWRVKGAGWWFVPLGVATYNIFPTEGQQKEFPGEPEKVQRLEDEPLKEDEVRAIHLSHPPADQALFYPLIFPENKGQRREVILMGPKLTLAEIERDDKPRYEAIMKDSLHLRLSSEPNFTVTWHLAAKTATKEESRKAFQFVKNVGSVDKAWGRLYDQSRAVLQDWGSKMTHAECLRVIEQLSELVQDQLEKEVGENIEDGEKPVAQEGAPDHGEPWGIIIDNVSILDFNPGRRIKESLANAAVAREDRKKEREAADASAYKITTEGNAQAEVTIRTADAEAHAITKVGDAMMKPGAKWTRRMQVAETIGKNANLIVAPGIGPEHLGLIGAAKQIWKEPEKTVKT
jgi:regulator of protease activity HflC (stomatin/prohibitin superfamily)